MATDLLARIRSEIDARLTQLRPLLHEYERLTVAAETLAAVNAETHSAKTHAAKTHAAKTHAAKTQAAETHPAVDAETHAAETPAAVDAPPLPPPAQEAPTPPAEEPSSAPTLRRAHPPRGSAHGAIKLAMSLRTTPLIQQATSRPAANRAAPTPSATQVLERPTLLPSAEEETWAASTPVADSEHRREPASPAAIRQAILAALDHGSHTASELVKVTAMSTPEIRGGLSRLAGGGAITKVKRRGDGRTAYALPSARA